MRTNRIFAIAAVVMALAACTKEQALETGSSFKKGQEVTLNVTADASATKVASELNSDKTVGFTWEEGDSIKVKVGADSAVFTITSFNADSTVGTFTGTMPAAGDTFSVQYPYTEPDLTVQTYSSTEPIPHNMMKLAATGCTTSSLSFTLTPQNAVLRLNLYGGARSVSQIVVFNTSTSDTYTLTCSPAKVVGKDKDHATPFFIVVPVGSGSWNFSAAVTAAEVTSTSDNTVSYETYGVGIPLSLSSTIFSPAAAQAFTAGGILNMPAKSLTMVWAPVNCGYSSTYTYGLLYQWGRRYGQAYETGTITPETMSKSDDTESNKDKFGLYNEDDYNWFSGGVVDTLWNIGTESSPVKASHDPCPTGWRVPTKAELTALFGGTVSPSFAQVNGQYGCYFNGTSSASSGVFLPAAGERRYDNGSVSIRGVFGYYWSSSVSGNSALGLYLFDGGVGTSNYSRAYGNSVRCVQE